MTASRAAITTPILFDPGEDWEYGSNIDWAGQVVEGILGQRLGVAMQDRVFDRLGMTDSAFAMRPDMRARMATMHQRDAAGVLSPLVDWADLDGALLIANDCFDGIGFAAGRIVLRDRPGIGVEPRTSP